MPDIKTVWDLTPLLENDEDIRFSEILKDSQEACKRFVKKWHLRTDYLEDPNIMKEALDDYEMLAREYDGTGSAGYYFWLRRQQEQANPKIKSKYNKVKNTETRINNDLEFFTNRISRIAQNTQTTMLNHPDLTEYKHFLEKLFESAKYILSESEEKILNLKNQPSFSNWVHMTKEFISKEEREVIEEDGNKETKAFSELFDLLDSHNNEVRRDASRAINDILAKHADVAEQEINSILLSKKIDDELRNIERPDVTRHIVDDIDTSVVDTLLKSVTERFDIPSRYYKLKASLLGRSKITYQERNMSLGELNKKHSFDKAVSLVKNTFRSLDPDFGDIFDKMISNGQIDVYPQKGRDGEAFCTHRRIKDPVYIMLNYTGKMDDVLTLAHELGHAINDTLISRNQNALNFDTPLSTAEVASTFMEDFVFERLSREYKPQDYIHVIMEKLNDDVATIFRQVACYKFEQDLHKTFKDKDFLSKEDIGQIFIKHMKSYMGDAVDFPEGSENWWIYWDHIRSFFYVYSYSSGLLISKSLQRMVRKDKDKINVVKTFLSAGLSESPQRLFLEMGIDIKDENFWSQGLKEVDELLKQAEYLAGQQQLSN